MKRFTISNEHGWLLSACVWVAVATMFYCGGAAAPASAAYEQVGNFAGAPGQLELQSGTHPEVAARWPEDVQLGGVGGMAVNYTGAGGVPAGTIYAATNSDEGGVARYNPDGSFSEMWSFVGNPPTRRCGPEGAAGQPVCASEPGAEARGVDVDVDQSTGYVYFLSSGTNEGQARVHVYTPEGSKIVAEFAIQAAPGETIEQSPEKMHRGGFPGGLAVDAAGDVYIYDEDLADAERVMKFEPASPGDYEHYAYAGQAHDLTWSGSPARPVADAAGYIYVARGSRIAKLDPSHPGAAPVCEFSTPSGIVEAITVNPLDGEVFYYEYHSHEVHRLLPCSEGEFEEAGATARLSPLRNEVGGLAFDPVRRFAPDRPPGILYLGATTGEGGNGEGEFPLFKSESSLGYVFARPLELAPAVASESVSHVTSGSAMLGAQVNPEGSPTRYAFQYVTLADYEANKAGEPFAGAAEDPLGGGAVGEGNGAVAVSAALSGLAANTAYRYRIVTSSHCSVEEPEKMCETAGELESFHTFAQQTAGLLPDGRVYELVSPPQKDGGQVYPADPSVDNCDQCKPGFFAQRFPRQSADDGDSVVFEGSPFSANEGPVLSNEYIARRDPQTGWHTVDLTPKLLTKNAQGYIAFSADLSTGLLEQQGAALSGEAPGEYDDLYTQPSTAPSSLTSLLGGEPPNRPASGNGPFEVRYAGASADLSRVFFEANDALTQEDRGIAPAAVDGGSGKFNLYEWHGGHMALVNVLPGNTLSQPGAKFGTPDAHAISEDGTRVFFSDEAGQVYVRENGQSTKEVETEGTPDPGRFLAAAADGSAVLLANGHLHHLGGEEAMVDLTEGKGGFQGLVGQSDDLTHIYFVDTKVLTGEEENEHCTVVAGQKSCERAGEGKDNLYGWTAAGTHFIGTLATADSAEGTEARPYDWAMAPARRTAQASPNGRFLAFESVASLTGYDNTGPCESNQSGGLMNGPCPEVFLYDSAIGRLVCASCNRSGERPLGYSLLRRIPGLSSELGQETPLPRYLSNEGRLFFDSEDSLVAADTNEGVEDVYEYEPNDLGSCREDAGCVSLISKGTGEYDSNFLAADPSGNNVFFTTEDRLSPRDGDELIDLYDARIGGGVPSEEPPAESECHGEGCQPQAGSEALLTPSTISFAGAGNLVSPLPVANSSSSKPPAKPRKKKTQTKPRKKRTKQCATGKRAAAGKSSHGHRQRIVCTGKHNGRGAATGARSDRGGAK